MNNGLVVPVFEGSFNIGVGSEVALFEEGERAVREDDTPAIGCTRRVLLDDGDLVGWVEFLHEQGEIQARRAAANNAELHEIAPSLGLKEFATIPAGTLGFFTEIFTS